MKIVWSYKEKLTKNKDKLKNRFFVKAYKIGFCVTEFSFKKAFLNST